jgi:mannosyltransferase
LPDVVVTNLHRRYTGVSATVRALVPLQRQEMAIGLLDWGHLGLSRQLHWWQLLWQGWSRPSRGRYRIWHARRDTEILLGLWLKKVVRQPWKIVFTSAAPKPPGRWLAALLRYCDAVIATSERSAAFLQGSAEIIHHGVDLEHYSPPPGDGIDQLRESVQWPGVVIPPALQHRYWIGAFGRIRPSKGTDLLVDALIEVLPDFPDFAAVLTGLCQAKDLDYFRSMQDKIQAAGLRERIVFLGDLERDAVRSCYRRSILCVAASRTEGFGLTPLEAMACGRAVLVSGAGVWPQVVDSEVGAVFETGSALSLAAALRQLLPSPGQLWQMGQRGRQRAIERHSLQREADRINALYGQLMV